MSLRWVSEAGAVKRAICEEERMDTDGLLYIQLS